MRGDHAKALASFEQALKLNPRLEAAHLNRALTYLRANEPAKALPDLDVLWADEHAALRADAAYHYGIALDRLGRAAEAETWLDRALTLDPSLDSALLYVGALRERRDDLQGAGRAYLDYLGKHPDSVAAMLRLGVSAQKAGRADVAKTYLEKVIAAAPDSGEADEARKFLVLWE